MRLDVFFYIFAKFGCNIQHNITASWRNFIWGNIAKKSKKVFQKYSGPKIFPRECAVYQPSISTSTRPLLHVIPRVFYNFYNA